MIISQQSAALKSHERFKQALDAPLGLIGTDTGHHDINLMTGGFMPTKITTLAGRSGFAKTAFVVPMGKAAGRVVNGRRSEVLVFSWEMSADYILDRFICHELGITLAQLRYPKILPEETRRLIPATYHEASKLPIHYHGQSSSIETCTKIMDEFLTMVDKKQQIEGVKIQPVMVLDFIGRIKDSSQYKGSKTYSIEHFLMGLKEYNNKTGFSSFILAQILRSADDKEFPEVVDIKDSSSIEENSDNLILGSRPEYLGKETIRNPRTGEEMPSHNKMLMRFVKTRENQPQDIIANCDMRYFRLWSQQCRDYNYDYVTELYGSQEFWRSQVHM